MRILVSITVTAGLVAPVAALVAADAASAMLPEGGCAPAELRYVTVDVPGASATQVRDLNGAGRVVGRSGNGALALAGEKPMAGFVHDLGTGAFTPVAVSGRASTYPEGIDDRGVVTGFAGAFNQAGVVVQPVAGFRWTPAKVAGDAPTVGLVQYPGLGSSTFVYKGNDTGSVAGFASDGAGAPHSFVEKSGFTDVTVAGANNTYLNTVDDTGRLAGGAALPTGNASFVRDGSGERIVTIPCGAFSISDTNARGDLAGSFTAPDGTVHGVVVSAAGSAAVVDVPGAVETRVYGIDEIGRVAGEYRTVAGGLPHGFVGLEPRADLRLVATATPEPTSPARDVTERHTVTNDGPSAAHGVVLRLEGAQATAISTSCTTDGAYRLCPLGTLAAHEVRTVTVTRRYPIVGTYARRSSVSASTTDPNLANNTATVTTNVVVTSADLALTVSDAPDPALAGLPMSETWTVRNAGPDDAIGVVLELPSRFPNAVTPPPDCTLTGNISVTWFQCNLGTLAAGASTSRTMTVTHSTTGKKSASGSVRATTADPNLANNTAVVATTVVRPVADLAVTVAVPPGTQIAGLPVTQVWTVRNLGPQPATAATLSLANVAFNLDGSSMAAPSSCTARESRLYDCPLGTIAPNEAVTRTVTVTYPATAGVRSYQGTATTTATDPVSGNNSATAVTVSRQPAADLSLTVMDQPDPGFIGMPATLRWTVSNTGPDPAPGGILELSNPAFGGFGAPTAAFPADCATSSSGFTAQCPLPVIPAGGSVTREVQLTASSPGTFGIAGSVSSAATDGAASNNRATSSTTFRQPGADLQLTATGPSSGFVGVPLTQTWTVTNLGPDPAPGARIRFTNPAAPGPGAPSVTFPSDCTSSYPYVICPLPTIPAGGSVSRSLAVTAGSPVTAGISGSVSSIATDKNTANNSASSGATFVRPTADLMVAVAAPQTALVGREVVQTWVVTNLGPNPAPGGVLRFPDPSVGGPNAPYAAFPADCARSIWFIDCPLPILQPGLSVTRRVTLTYPVPYTYSMGGSVTTTASDPVSTNNSATVSTTARLPKADLGLTVTTDRATAVVGEDVVQTWTITNHGAEPADAAVLSLPAKIPGFNIATVTYPEGCAGTVAFQMECTLGTIPAGGTVTREVRVRWSQPGTYQDQGSVRTTSTDTRAENDTAISTTTVVKAGGEPQ